MYHVLKTNETTYELGRDDGKALVMPRVTSILSVVRRDLETIPKDVLQHAAMRGRAVHRAIWIVEGGPDASGLHWDSLAAEVRPYVEAYVAFKKATNAKIIEKEVLVVSERFGYAGRLDLMARGLTSATSWDIVDVKTGVEHWTHDLQVAAYVQGYKEQNNIRRQIHRWKFYLRGDGTYRLMPCKNTQEVDFKSFCHVQGTYQLIQAHGGNHA